MQLLKLVESEIQMDVALPWNVRNHDCTLLLARGHIVSSEAQMQALLERGIYVDLEEKRAVEALDVPKSGPVKSIYTRWADTIDTLETLVHELPHAPEFPANIEKLAQELITLADLEPISPSSWRSARTRPGTCGMVTATASTPLCCASSWRSAWTGPPHAFASSPWPPSP